MLLNRMLEALRAGYRNGFCQQRGISDSPSPMPTPLAIQFSEVSRVVLPVNLAIFCSVFAVVGAFVRVLIEEKRARRPSRSNWLTFGISSLIGIPFALAACEALFRTQPWARESFFFLCCLSFVLASQGQGILMECHEAVILAVKTVTAKGVQVIVALFTSPLKDGSPKNNSAPMKGSDPGEKSE